MSSNYRTHLIDKQAHTWATLRHQILETPAPQPTRLDVQYRTRSTSAGTLTYAIVGMGSEKRLTVGEGSIEHLAIQTYILKPSNERFDAVLAIWVRSQQR